MRFTFRDTRGFDESLIPLDNLEEFVKVFHRVSKKKGEIDAYINEWEIAKRMIHEHEYIYTSSFLRKNICDVCPVSRSYFKIVEILQDYNIPVKDTTALCLAEAPGGFIQRFLESGIAQVYGITLISPDKRVPYWNGRIKCDRFKELSGVAKNGDLTNFANILDFVKKVGKVGIVTGDGGFDTSDDYDAQERVSFPLIFSEVYLALRVQEVGGCFVCKIFDTFLPDTIALLGILYQVYDRVVFHKPSVSRLSNSEKYVVCLGFKGASVSLMNDLTHVYLNKFKGLSLDVPEYFLEDMKDFVEMYANKQCQMIDQGISLIQSKTLQKKPTPLQIECSLDWCKRYSLATNEDCLYLNQR